ncbi:hypothetical protein TNCV_4282511 [Trichonephila clavipes]|nr:hypothetical protein TNCV_4282511 [Trichonephila clavipes]
MAFSRHVREINAVRFMVEYTFFTLGKWCRSSETEKKGGERKKKRKDRKRRVFFFGKRRERLQQFSLHGSELVTREMSSSPDATEDSL